MKRDFIIATVLIIACGACGIGLVYGVKWLVGMVVHVILTGGI